MPLSGDAKTKYQREYMRKRRAAAREGKGLTGSNTGGSNKSEGGLTGSNRSTAKPERKPEQQTYDREAMTARMHEAIEAQSREYAQWGGRPKSLVIGDIKRLLQGRFRGPDDVRRIIVEAIAPHVRDQANINDGIPRQVFRKVLAGLHTDRNPATAEAFIAFKQLDARDGGKPNPDSIVIADDKVRTMSDFWRKREERRERRKQSAGAKGSA